MRATVLPPKGIAPGEGIPLVKTVIRIIIYMKIQY